ncbi:hypothetical protein ACFP2T_40675 [Plantactinospora solaniradicis]|uniref:Secreted protein n=1 Tax=Plantactinospora solaniradicis TaxID=1723736 RepID=A0ABW1KNR0_9ACTN
MRFVTALVLMALLLGGGARTGLPGATGAAELRPDAAAATATSSTVDVEASAGDLTAVEADESSTTDSDTTAVVAGAVPVLGQPARSEVRPGTGAGSRPAGDAYARVIGPRAPPLG